MHWSDLASFLKTTAEQLHIPAGFCTVTQAHRTLFSCACGADKDALEKSRGASYWIYSATKPICAAAAMQMVEAALIMISARPRYRSFCSRRMLRQTPFTSLPHSRKSRCNLSPVRIFGTVCVWMCWAQ